MVINQYGEYMSLALTHGNTDDRKPVEVLTKDLLGRLFGDLGYIGKQLFIPLLDRGLTLVTKLKKNMQNKLMRLEDKILLRKRSIIETCFDYLKNKFSLEHTRHRSPINAIIYIFSTIVSYALKPLKPAISMYYYIG